MTPSLPCPNPHCTHVFAPEELEGVAAVACSECGGVFQLKVVDAAPQRPIRDRRRGGGWGGVITTVLMLETFIVMLALVAWGGYRQMTRPGRVKEPEPYRSQALNFQFQLPDAAWGRDDPTQGRLKANFLLHREKPDVWVALTVRDYKTRQPPMTELVDEGLRQLRAFFRGLAQEPRPEAELAGLPAARGPAAARFVFQGEAGDRLMTGECRVISHQGFGYWLACWCPADQVADAQPEFEQMQARFTALDQRPNWKPEQRTFSGPKGDYILTDAALLWEVPRSVPIDYDPLAELARSATEKVESGYPDRKALLLVLRLPPGDPRSVGAPALADAAKAHLLEREKEVYPDSTLQNVPPSGEAVTDKVGSASGQVVTVQVVNTPERKRFAVLGVVPRPDGVLVIQAECDDNRRPQWEGEFRRLIGSFKLETK
jgi:hypothetical protein